MEFAFIEGFDDYPNNMAEPGIGVAAAWIGANGYNNYLTAGRFGGRALGISSGGVILTRAIPVTDKFAVGIALKPIELANNGGGATFLQWGNLLRLRVDNIGRIQLCFTDDTVKAVSDKVLLNYTWHYVEIEFDCKDVGGKMKLWIDGELAIEFAGDTKFGPDSTMDRVFIMDLAFYPGMQFDDYYLRIDEATRLGEVKAVLLTATATVQAEWTPSAGANLDNIDEAQLDNDATYNETLTVGAKDLFEFADMPGIPETVHAIQITMAARKDDSATRRIRSIVKQGATETQSDDFYQTNAYTWQRWILTKDKDNLPWTKAKVDQLKVGYILVE